MENKLNQTADAITETARNVEGAVKSVEAAAARVESNVREGVQPDMRHIRLAMSEIDEKTNVRLKRIYWALLVLLVVNIGTFLAVVVG